MLAQIVPADPNRKLMEIEKFLLDTSGYCEAHPEILHSLIAIDIVLFVFVCFVLRRAYLTRASLRQTKASNRLLEQEIAQLLKERK